MTVNLNDSEQVKALGTALAMAETGLRTENLVYRLIFADFAVSNDQAQEIAAKAFRIAAGNEPHPVRNAIKFIEFNNIV